MAMLSPGFLYGVINKTLILGGIAGAIGYFAVSVSFAGAVVIGALMTAINMRTVAWAMKKALDPDRGGKGSNMWSLLLAGKMLALIGAVWWLIAVVDVNAVGFAVGFSLFMPAIGWQMVVAKPEENGSEEGKS